MQYCLCVSALVTGAVEDKHERAMCHGIATLDDIRRMHPLNTVRKMSRIGSEPQFKGQTSRENPAKIGDNSKPPKETKIADYCTNTRTFSMLIVSMNSV